MSDETVPEPEKTTSGIYAAIRKTAWHTNIQWGVVGAFLVGGGSFVSWSLTKLDVVNVAMAQAQITAVSNQKQIEVIDSGIKTIDAGARAAIERLERKIDVNNEANEKKLQAIQATMDTVLREVRKR
jgi:hypothetical protein